MALYFNLTQLSEKTMILHPVEESIFETLSHILLSNLDPELVSGSMGWSLGGQSKPLIGLNYHHRRLSWPQEGLCPPLWGQMVRKRQKWQTDRNRENNWVDAEHTSRPNAWDSHQYPFPALVSLHGSYYVNRAAALEGTRGNKGL